MSDIVNPPDWPRPSGYANGVIAKGRYLAISGQIGWDRRNELVSDDFLEQARQALSNIVAVVRTAGGGPEHLVSLTWYVVDKHDYRANLRALGKAYREIVGEHYPAMALVQVADLLEEGACVEISAIAILPD
ncbi:MAG TPA: RidA family protein [Candidatus Baltobacteraceae bacterium]|nr:RidA family protein [Candidatus Baltobacteraceae bacterium]